MLPQIKTDLGSEVQPHDTTYDSVNMTYGWRRVKVTYKLSDLQRE